MWCWQQVTARGSDCWGKTNAFPFVFERDYDPGLRRPAGVAGLSGSRAELGACRAHQHRRRSGAMGSIFCPHGISDLLSDGLELFLLTRNLDESALEISDNQMRIHDPEGREILEIPLVLGQLLEPNWFSPWDENPQVGIFSVLEFDRMAREGDEKEKARAKTFFEALNDAVILIGPTDPLMKDLSEAPMSGRRPVPRVSLHGNVFKTLDSGRFPEAAPKVGQPASDFWVSDSEPRRSLSLRTAFHDGANSWPAFSCWLMWGLAS